MDLALIVRGLAALQVLEWHAVGFELTGWPWDLINVSGTQCVWLFFTLSGYLVSLGFESGRYSATDAASVRQYILARAARILPLYTLVALVTFFATHETDWIRLLRALSFTHQSAALPTTLWTVVIEMRFYVIVPVLYWGAKHGFSARWQLIVYFGLAAIPALRALFAVGGFDDRTFLGNASHFYAGYLVHGMASTTKTSSKSLWLIFIGSLAVGAVLFARDRGLFWLAGPFVADVGAIAMLLLHRRLERATLSRRAIQLGRVLAGPGVIAYGIYAWHAVVFATSDGRPSAWRVLAVTICASIASYVLLERPVRRLVKAASVARLAPASVHGQHATQ